MHDIWARDEEAQMYKLSERQKAILDLLPEMTSDEAFDKIDELNEELSNQSRAYKKAVMDKNPFAKSIARELKCNVSTLKHDLDRVSEGTHKSLLEIGLVEKIQLDENNSKSPNFYYKVQHEGNVLNDNKSNVQDSKITFAHSLNSSIVKQKIISDLLIYANIIINKRGMYALEKYCNEYTQDIDVENYNQVFDFLQGFFDFIDYDVHTIDVSVSTIDDINCMMKFHESIVKKLQDEKTHTHDPEEQKICTSKEIIENSSKEKQSTNKNANEDFPILHIVSLQFQEYMKEKHIDVEIASLTYELLSKLGASTLQAIINHICEGIDPEDFNEDITPLKIETHVNKMYIDDLLDIEHRNNKEVYVMQESFIKLAKGGDDV